MARRRGWRRRKPSPQRPPRAATRKPWKPEIFCAVLGGFAGSLAMAVMAAGGVYLAGGFLSSMFALLEHSAFEERFLHGRSVRAFLSNVPVRVTEHGRQGVLGAATWYLRRGAPGVSTPAHVMTDGAAP